MSNLSDLEKEIEFTQEPQDFIIDPMQDSGEQRAKADDEIDESGDKELPGFQLYNVHRSMR